MSGSDLDLSPLDLKFALLVTLVHRCVPTELKVFQLYCSEKIGGTRQTHRRMDGWLGFNGILSTQVAAISCLGRTDGGVQHLMRPLVRVAQ